MLANRRISVRLRNALVLVMATVALASAAGVAWLLRDPRPWFDRRHSAIASVQEQPAISEGKSLIQSVRLTARSGLVVDLTWKRALSDSGRRRPVALILGGQVMGAEAVKFVGETPGLMVAAMAYPFDGDLKPSVAKFIRQVPAIRQAFLDTPPAMSVALDWLRARSDVDTTRLELIGVSLGAPFATIVGARDTRVSRVWVLHGSGGSYGPLEQNMRRTIRWAPLRALLAATANVIIAGPRLAPERWVGGISPRPFVMVNAQDDERLPREAIQSLFDAAGQPKEMIWMSGSHIHGDRETIQRLVQIVLSRMRPRS